MPPVRRSQPYGRGEDEIAAALALSLVSLPPLRDRAALLMERGSARDALATLSSAERKTLLERAAQETEACRRRGFQLIGLLDPDYPHLLRRTVDPPLVLYVWGELIARDVDSVSVVGSRRATRYGVQTCETLTRELARRGLTIVSGLARGIDAVAHRAALDVGGRTIAVVGSGLGHLYPHQHARLARRIAEQGAVLSEFPLETPPLPPNFPRRNRVISGMSLGTVVIEAAERSGSLITVKHAIDQNREVFATPGPIASPNTRGVHRLIQDGAKLVAEPDDVIRELTPEVRERLDAREDLATAKGVRLVPDEQIVFNSLLDTEESDTDLLVAGTGLPPQRVMAALVGLEIRGLVRAFPGGFYRARRT